MAWPGTSSAQRVSQCHAVTHHSAEASLAVLGRHSGGHRSHLAMLAFISRAASFNLGWPTLSSILRPSDLLLNSIRRAIYAP